MGKLKDLDAHFDKKTKLCNVYDDYNNLKTTLLVKNKHRKNPISKNLKLLEKSDGTQILFYRQKDGTWANVQNAHMNFKETDIGYVITLDNGDTETYDYNGQLIEMTKGELVISLEYNDNKLAQVSDNLEHTILFKYKEGLIRKIINYDDTSIDYKHEDKNLVQVTYADGRTMRYEYNDDNQLSKVYRDGILIRSYMYDEQGRVETATQTNGKNPKTFSYDSQNIEVQEHDEIIPYTFVLNHSQAKLESVETDEGMAVYAYDDNGHQISFTDKLGVTRVTLYDKNGLLKEDLDKVGTGAESVQKIIYDKETRKPLQISEPRKITYNVYDNKGQLSYKVDTLVDENGYVEQNKIEHRIYNEKGLPVQVDTGKQKSTIQYDNHGNAVAVTSQLGLTDKVTKYNKADLPVTSIDSDGEVTQNQYDKMGRKTKEIVDGRTTATMKYDAQGRLVKRTSKDAVTSYFKYDDEGHIVESGDNTGEKNIYIFDAYGNISKTEKYQNGVLVYQDEKRYDVKHHLLSHVDAYGNTTTYIYNQKGQKVEMTDAKDNATTYTYNDIGKLATQTDALGGVTSYTYDEAGYVTGIITPNGTTFEYSYDGFGRLVSETNPDRGVTEYTYDSEDMVLSVTNSNGYSKTNHYD
ncbi:MAG: RHS repeat protein, partial [Epsilonproteobacteria bacterium]|nr:RHS repeat protein [Campylobacterota bacterium]